MSTTKNGDSTATGTADDKTTEAGNRSLTLGESAKIDGGLEGTVESYRFTSKYESGGTTQSTDKTFLFVKFNVENPTDSRKDIPAKMSIYVTINGKRYDPTDYKGAVRSLYTSGSLDAGAKRSGVLIFKVPKRTKRSNVVSCFRYSGSDGTVTHRWHVA